MSSVFLLQADCWPEGSTPLIAFRLREDAEVLKARAIEYDQDKPVPPQSNDEHEWERHDIVYEQWCAEHPIAPGFSGSGGEYSIVELPLQ